MLAVGHFRVTILVALCLLAAPLASAAADAGEVLKLLDLARPGLERVKDASERGDDARAMTELLAHFRTRSIDYHFDSNPQIRDLPGVDRYPDDAPFVPSIRGLPVGVQDTSSSEDILRRRLTFLHHTVDFGDQIDWRHKERDVEWTFMLNRHTHLLTLAEAYRRGGEDRYVAALAAQMREWDRQVDPAYPRRLEVGIRLRNWVWLFPVVVRSNHFDAELLTIYLENVHGMAQHLNARGAAGYSSSNHGAMEAVGVLHAATYFPEFRDAGSWRDSTAERMLQHILDSTFDDGVYHGRSPGYHNVVLREVSSFYQMMQRQQRPMPKEFIERFQAMVDFAAAFTRPDLTSAQFGHSDSDLMTDRLLELGRQVNRPDVLFVATQGKEGTKPTWRDKLFPTGEFATLRSDWSDGPAARWAMFDFGPRARGGLRCLSVDLYAYGRPLVVMPGRYSYVRQDRALFESTRFLNTVSIDDKDQDPKPRCALARSKLDGNLKVLHAWHDGYSHLLNGKPESIVHERQLVMVRDRYWIVADLVRSTDGSREFTFDQNWRFMPTALAKLDGDRNGMNTGYNGANIAIIPLAGEGDVHQEQSWFSPKYGVKYPSPRLWYRHRSAGGWFFVTLLVPYEGQQLPLRAIGAKPGQDAVRAKLTWADGHLDDVDVSFGVPRGTGTTRWKGSREGQPIGEEACE
jgi:hypothetical protein